MNKQQLHSVVSKGVIFVDGRYLNDYNVGEFLTTLTLKLNKLGVPIKIGLLIPLDHNEDEYQKIMLEFDDKEYDLSYFFFVHSKVNFEQVSIDALKVIFERNTDVLFITQNQSIAFDVANLSSDRHQVFVRRVSYNSLLEAFPMIIGDKFDDRPLFSYINGRSPRIDKIAQECYIPTLGEKVSINGKDVMLKEQIGIGGEGTVYSIGDELVAKIYNKDRLTKTRVDKIVTMVNKRVNDYSICWPIAVVKNKDNFVIGYTMKKCIGKPISTLYRGPVVTQQNYPNYSIESAIYISIAILTKIQKLHYNNVLLGDINDRNFLINNLDEVYLIDTDSYQIEDYSCDVGTIGYIAPELKEGMLSSTLRTFEDEGYGVAVFVFRTLMLGYFPFAQVGSNSDYVELIKKQNFPYQLNSKKTKKLVPPLAYETWEQFSPLLKRMFINTFMLDKKTLTQDRYSVEQWIIALENYLDVLESEYL